MEESLLFRAIVAGMRVLQSPRTGAGACARYHSAFGLEVSAQVRRSGLGILFRSSACAWGRSIGSAFGLEDVLFVSARAGSAALQRSDKPAGDACWMGDGGKIGRAHV